MAQRSCIATLPKRFRTSGSKGKEVIAVKVKALVALVTLTQLALFLAKLEAFGGLVPGR